MDPDATYKSILSYAIMVEELMHWLVADRHGMHALVDALDFSTLTRMQSSRQLVTPQATQTGGTEQRCTVALRATGGFGGRLAAEIAGAGVSGAEEDPAREAAWQARRRLGRWRWKT